VAIPFPCKDSHLARWCWASWRTNAARLRRWRSATSLADAEKPRTLTNFKKAPARSVRNTRMLEPLCHRVKETCYRSPPFTATFKEAYELPTKFDAANANTVCSRSVGKPSCLPTKPTPKRISSAKPSHLSPIPTFKTCQLRFSRWSSQFHLLEQAQRSLLAA